MRAVTLGLLSGIAGALFCRALRASLFGVGADDPTSYAAACFLLAMTAASPALFPARRASRVNPMEALRTE